MGGDTTDWKDLREFRGVDLTRSYVLSWSLDGDRLLIDVDVCLLPTHAFYEVPRPSERECIRAAVVEFPGCAGLETGSPAAAVLPGALRGGRIDSFRRKGEGQYEITGTFGTVAVTAARPLLRFHTTHA